LAASCAGYVVAMHLHAKRHFTLGFRGRCIAIPTPFNRYTLWTSAPMSAPAATQDNIAQALWSLRDEAAAEPHLSRFGQESIGGSLP
jgi:hypothetical protein